MLKRQRFYLSIEVRIDRGPFLDIWGLVLNLWFYLKIFLKAFALFFWNKRLSEKRALSLLIAIIIPHLPYRSTPVFLMTLLNTYNHINTILVMLQDYTVGSFYWSLTCLTPSSFIGKISINKLIILAQEFGAINWSRGIIWIWFLFYPTM